MPFAPETVIARNLRQARAEDPELAKVALALVLNFRDDPEYVPARQDQTAVTSHIGHEAVSEEVSHAA